MALSEKDLLLLDCFMYTSASVKGVPYDLKTFLSKYADSNGVVKPENLNGFKFSGDMDAEKMADVMTQMLKSEELMKLTVVDSINDGIRGACFVNMETDEATVAFRGTGGSYDQWYDNLEGYGQVSTEAQRKAAQFIEDQEYCNITVTGHSKGGNLAMYVTIVCAYKIGRCVSYEGQGFSDEFCDKYADEIAEAKEKGKIISISGNIDPVHGLLTPIASEERFVHTNSSPVPHGAYGILSHEDNHFDENGNFTSSSYCDESIIIEGAGLVTEILSSLSDIPVIGSLLEHTADMLGVVAGLVFDHDDWDEAWESIKKSWNELCVNLKKDIIRIYDSIIEKVDKIRSKLRAVFDKGYQCATANPQIKLDTYKLNAYAQRLQSVNRRISNLDGRLDSLYWRVGLLGLWNLMQADALTGYSWRLNRCANYLNDTASDFDSVENNLVNSL